MDYYHIAQDIANCTHLPQVFSSSIQVPDKVLTSSSDAFRFDLPSALASEIYERSLKAISMQYASLIKGKYNFKNQPEIARKLRDLASNAHDQFMDAQSALDFQNQRREDLTEVGYWNDCISCCIFRPALNNDSLDGIDVSWIIRDTHWPFNHPCSDFIRSYREAVAEVEKSKTKREFDVRMGLLQTKLALHLAEHRVLRYETLEKAIVKGVYAPNEVERFRGELPTILDEWDEVYKAYMKELTDRQHQLQRACGKIGVFRKYTILFRRLEQKCSSDANFMESQIVFFTGPFRFLDLPLELRYDIYDLEVEFKYLISDKYFVRDSEETPDGDLTASESKDISCRRSRNRYVLHPLFRTSKQIRLEVAHEFYTRNGFGCRSISTLWTSKLSPDFGNLIIDLSITWPSLGVESVKAHKALKSFKGLRRLKIYLNWSHLLRRHFNTLEGVAAFEFVIDHLVTELRSLEKVDIFEVDVNSKEDLRFHSILSETESGMRSPFKEFYAWEDPVTAIGFSPSERALELEDKFDRMRSSRILNVHDPNTVYSRCRLPQKPSSLFRAEANAKKRRRVVLGNKNTARSILREIRRAAIDVRGRNVWAVAAEKARREADQKWSEQGEQAWTMGDESPWDEENALPDIEPENHGVAYPYIANLEEFWGTFDSYFLDESFTGREA